MPATPKLWQAALPVLDCLEGMRVPYLLGGRLAGRLWGLHRSAPQDIPVVAPLTLPHAAPLIAALEGSYFVDAGKTAQSIRRHSAFQLIHLQTLLRVEITASEDSPFNRSVLARRIGREISEIAGRALYFASPEDVVLHTLLTLPRDGTPDPRWDEIQGSLGVHGPTLDLAYLRTWARRLGLTQELDRAFARLEQR